MQGDSGELFLLFQSLLNLLLFMCFLITAHADPSRFGWSMNFSRGHCPVRFTLQITVLIFPWDVLVLLQSK